MVKSSFKNAFVPLCRLIKTYSFSGAGIAGLTLAYWLKKYGFNPTIVETHDALRGGGYMIDFWGSGFDIAEKMDLLPQLEREHCNIPEVTFVNEEDERTGGFNVYKLRRLINFRHFNLLRSGLAAALYNTIKGDVEFIWGNSIENIEQGANAVNIRFKNGRDKQYDLAIGADGQHSRVRKLIFEGEGQFEKYLGYYASSYTINNYQKEDNRFRSFTIPGRQVSVYGMGENKFASLFLFRQREKLPYNYHQPDEAKKILRAQFKNVGWECPQLLSEIDNSADFYFDSVSQVILPNWSKGRVTLLGDACQCVSLIAGAGSGLALGGAYVLAGELKVNNENFEKAFINYRSIMIPEVLKKQKIGVKFANSFLPNSQLGIWIRDRFTNLMFLPFVSKWFIKQFLLDSLKFKDY